MVTPPYPTVSTLTVDSGVSVFYRTAGPATSTKAVLLLHGFPSSSHQFRHLIPLLADQGYRVVAPDLPGYGFTTVSAERGYVYGFASFAKTVEALVDALGITELAVYIFDYGAPTALRLALNRPDLVKAIVAQNGNAYLEGLGKDFWAPIDKYWQSGKAADRVAIKGLLEIDATKWQYETGTADKAKLQPEAWYLDQALMDRPGNKDIQLDVFYDYRTNLPLYPDFQKWFRDSGVPVLAAWGKHDQIFVPAGAEAFKKDVKDVEVHLLDAGHFVLESNLEEMAALVIRFLKRVYPA